MSDGRKGTGPQDSPAQVRPRVVATAWSVLATSLLPWSLCAAHAATHGRTPRPLPARGLAGGGAPGSVRSVWQAVEKGAGARSMPGSALHPGRRDQTGVSHVCSGRGSVTRTTLSSCWCKAGHLVTQVPRLEVAGVAAAHRPRGWKTTG